MIYPDFRTAYDRAPHHRLLLKSNAHGIGGYCWPGLGRGLAVGSKVQIRINKVDWGCVMGGVLQVSVLIPLLFIIKDRFHDFNFFILKLHHSNFIF